MQLERILRSQGFGSRPECRALIVQGRVRIGGETCDDPYVDLAPEGLVFFVDDTEWTFRQFAYLLMNKPAHYECSHLAQHHPSIYTLLPRPLLTRGVQSVGRLDEDTTGLLLFSDNGQFIHTYTSPKKKVPKVYDITLKHPGETELVARLLAGVELHDEPDPIAAAGCELLGEHLLRLTVTEGKYHLVKRMVAAAGNRVEGLNRVAIGGLSLPAELPPGQWRWLETSDLERLSDKLRHG